MFPVEISAIRLIEQANDLFPYLQPLFKRCPRAQTGGDFRFAGHDFRRILLPRARQDELAEPTSDEPPQDRKGGGPLPGARHGIAERMT